MDLINVLILIVISIVIGIIITLVVQYYVLVRYFNKGPIAETPKKQKVNAEAYSLPEELKKKLENNDAFLTTSTGSDGSGSGSGSGSTTTTSSSSASLPISLMLQFLFHELRYSDNIKRWLYKKLSLEFDELLTKTTIGKFFEAVTIRDMHLGSHFPDINDVSLDSIKLDKNEGHIETLNLSIKLDYTGNFLLSVDAKMKFGKTAYLSIKVKHISGIGRLQFTRIPYTHWSFSFYTEPQIELAVESHFQGRQLQANITNLIVNQIKKAIKRKHTLPNYKIRYKPFFIKTDPGQQDTDETDILLAQGQLEVACMDISRLDAPPDVTNVYCTFTVDAMPFICLYPKDNNALWLMMELTLTKIRQQQLGVIFKQETNGTVTVDSVTPQTPAYDSGLKHGDVIIAIENKNITHVNQIGKIVKAITSINISLKIERCTSNYCMNKSNSVTKTEDKTPTISLNDEEFVDSDSSFVILDKADDTIGEKEVAKRSSSAGRTRSDRVPKIITASNENMSKFAQTLGNFALRKRKSAVADKSTAAAAGTGTGTGTGNSSDNTPTPSCPGTPQHVQYKHHAIALPTNFGKKNSISEVPEITRTDVDCNDTTECSADMIQVHRSKEVPLKSMMSFNDDYCFHLKQDAKYLNINMWGVGAQREVLLGYTNIPLNEILNSCCNSLLGHYTKSYSFLPPNNTPPNSQSHPLMAHSGFEHVFCYGDILLSFVWNHDGAFDVVDMKGKNVAAHCNDDKPISILQKSSQNQHDFVRTQFHRSIHCDFCSKKIWLKDAVQCRDCGMCCHKKCIAKCQLSTECTLIADRTSLSLKSDLSDQPIELAGVGDSLDDNSMDDEATTSPYDGTPVKRVNSANNLSIPGAHIATSHSRSLPPSPQRTPSRKHSLVTTNPFALCPAALDEIQNAHEAHDAINKLLDHMLVCATDENIMETARESGRQLYATMVPDEKIDKINSMMIELKKMFDIVTTEHADLIRKLNNEDVEVERAKLAFLLGQADAKIHGLSVLMLHYCSGLQQS